MQFIFAEMTQFLVLIRPTSNHYSFLGDSSGVFAARAYLRNLAVLLTNKGNVRHSDLI